MSISIIQTMVLTQIPHVSSYLNHVGYLKSVSWVTFLLTDLTYTERLYGWVCGWAPGNPFIERIEKFVRKLGQFLLK